MEIENIDTSTGNEKDKVKSVIIYAWMNRFLMFENYLNDSLDVEHKLHLIFHSDEMIIDID